MLRCTDYMRRKLDRVQAVFFDKGNSHKGLPRSCLRDGRAQPSSIFESLLASSVKCGDKATQLRKQAHEFETERSVLVEARRATFYDT